MRDAIVGLSRCNGTATNVGRFAGLRSDRMGIWHRVLCVRTLRVVVVVLVGLDAMSRKGKNWSKMTRLVRTHKRLVATPAYLPDDVVHHHVPFPKKHGPGKERVTPPFKHSRRKVTLPVVNLPPAYED